ncbi:MAG: OsmC family protein [candidate division Zixibacteria bacterium]|nr:OsmC family protein [candidate division Zixibacteria bacterium]
MIKPYVKIPKNVDTELQWTDGLKFEANTGSKHSVTMDASPEHGGADDGARPMETLLSALGGCTGMDLITILKKKRCHPEELKINLHGERVSTHPHVFKSITMEYLIWGSDITDEDVQWALSLSLDKYCSVASMLKKCCKLNYKWRIYNKK